MVYYGNGNCLIQRGYWFQ